MRKIAIFSAGSKPELQAGLHDARARRCPRACWRRCSSSRRSCPRPAWRAPASPGRPPWRRTGSRRSRSSSPAGRRTCARRRTASASRRRRRSRGRGCRRTRSRCRPRRGGPWRRPPRRAARTRSPRAPGGSPRRRRPSSVEQLLLARAGLVLHLHVRVERDEAAVLELAERVDLGQRHVVLGEQPREPGEDRRDRGSARLPVTPVWAITSLARKSGASIEVREVAAPDVVGVLLGDLLDVDAAHVAEEHHRALADPVPDDARRSTPASAPPSGRPARRAACGR